MQLTQREQTIAERYAQGATYKTIAAGLEIAPSTVRNHLASVYRKLEVRNKPELIHALSAQMGADRAGLEADDGVPPTMPLLRHLDPDGPSPVDGTSIAIMPFENIGPPEAEYFGHGVAADLQHDLTRFQDLFVSGRSSCLALSAQNSNVTEVARKLGVKYVLQGTVRSHQKMVRLTAELVDGSTGQAYAVLQLADAAEQLHPGERLLVGPAAITDPVAGTVATLLTAGDFLDNGGVDGGAIRVMRESPNGPVIVDTVAYEYPVAGANEGATHVGFDGQFGDELTSFARCPDGLDTNVNSFDFALGAPSPGVVNECPDGAE